MKKTLSVLVIILLLSTVPASFSQEVTVAEKARQKLVEVTISSAGDVHVKHVVAKLDTPKQIDLIDGERSNLTVTDEDGDEKQFAEIGDGFALLIMPSREDTIVEYDLSGELELVDGVWTWDFFYRQSTAFILPENLDLIYTNDRPVYLGDKSGIMCHGCDMMLEYSINEPKNHHVVNWEDRNFTVVTRTHADMGELFFDQPGKRMGFHVESDNDIITIIIPQELLWGPYQVYQGDNKIFFSSYINNGTHVWLTIRPETSGNITIIGTTVIPEFPVALLVLSISVLAVIPLARKFNLR